MSFNKKNTSYIVGVMGLLILLIISLLGPKLLFSVQDRMQFNRVMVGERESWDITTFATSYEMSLQKRLQNFAEGLSEGKEYYVTEIDDKVDKETYELFQRLFKQDFIMGITVVRDDTDYNIEEWKRYVIYDEKYETGVAFLLGYAKLTTVQGQTFEILVDTQSDTIYYLRVTMDGKMFEKYGGEIAHISPYEGIAIIYQLSEYYEAEAFQTEKLEAENLQIITGEVQSFLKPFYYGDSYLNFRLQIMTGYDSGNPGIEFGIVKLAKLIIE